jgi:hypothetical protein
MSGHDRRGFLLSLDAIIAIGLMLTLVMFLGGLSLTYYAPELRYQRLYHMGKDLLMLLENARIEQLQDFGVIKYYQGTGVLTPEDLDRTLLEIIGSFWASDNATLHSHASNITGQVLNATLPANYRYKVVIGGDTIYQSGPEDGEYLARLSSIVSGIARGEPVEGYFARAYPAKVGRVSSSYYYFGGYVGEGNLTACMELPDYDSIMSMNMELDAGSNFTMYINGDPSGYYQRDTNETMRSGRWSVDPSYFGSLHNGTNTIGIGFDEAYSYIGGGYVRIVYNISNITAGEPDAYGDNASRMYRLPGIDGIINLYSSICVPGTLKAIDAYLHYESLISGLRVYLSLGRVPVYESNVTGETGISLTNSSISGNLSDSGYDFSYLNGRTVPLRLGLRNISYILGEAGFADVVLITDRTGSMESCDVESPGCPYPDCSWASGCQNYRSDIAADSDRLFVNTILGAEGSNYVGLIGYGESHGKTCSYHGISGDNASLQSRIGDYGYATYWEDCGWTCTSCGVAGATELLQENEVLYNLTLRQDIDRSEYTLDSGTTSRTVTLSLNNLNKSRFVNSRLTILARGDDTYLGYQQCVFLNGHYLGRVCRSSEGSDGWHTCEYVAENDWLNAGSNSIRLTNGDRSDCNGAGTRTWYAKDIRLSEWEYRTNESVVSTNTSAEGVGINMFDASALLWEIESDYPNPVDFTSGLNSSGDTFGLGTGDDGWDRQSGTYGFPGTCRFDDETGGELQAYTLSTDDDDKSCAYGIQFEVSQEMHDILQLGGRAEVSFNYEWDESGSWESSDQVWIKGRWTSPPGTACAEPGPCYLGSDLDIGHDGADGTHEVYTDNDPDGDYSGFFSQDVTGWIDGAGTYYLDIGGKVLRDSRWERGYFRFDNILVAAYNSTASEPVVRMSFPGVNMSRVKAATLAFDALGIDPDKHDCLYVNDYHIGRIDYQEINSSSGWQSVRFDIPVMYLQGGENRIEFSGGTDIGCNRTGENDRWSARNVRLSLVHSDEMHDYRRKKSMLIMSDGDANTLIGDCRNYDSGSCPAVPEWLTPYEETVQRACEAHDMYNITIYTVAFGNAGQDAEDMLRDAACCDNCSHFYNSSNADELQEIYSRIAQGILNATFEAQKIKVSEYVGAITRLYPDSYIRINYTSYTEPPEYGEININLESPRFENMSGPDRITDPVNYTKEGWFFVPGNLELLEARVTSYSSQYWTDRLYVRNSTTDWGRVYWLGDFGEENYTLMGDPFTVDIPAALLSSGDNNSVRIGTGFSAQNGTGGSPDSRVIYTGRISGITMEGYSDVYPRAEGSTVTIHYDIDGDNVSDGSVDVQVGTNPSDIFDPKNDSIDNAFMRLMDMLNVLWDSNPGDIGNGTSGNPYDGGIVSQANPIDFQITPDIRFDSAFISGVPTMWGPVEMEVRIWM